MPDINSFSLVEYCKIDALIQYGVSPRYATHVLHPAHGNQGQMFHLFLNAVVVVVVKSFTCTTTVDISQLKSTEVTVTSRTEGFVLVCYYAQQKEFKQTLIEHNRGGTCCKTFAKALAAVKELGLQSAYLAEGKPYFCNLL